MPLQHILSKQKKAKAMCTCGNVFEHFPKYFRFDAPFIRYTIKINKLQLWSQIDSVSIRFSEKHKRKYSKILSH